MRLLNDKDELNEIIENNSFRSNRSTIHSELSDEDDFLPVSKSRKQEENVNAAKSPIKNVFFKRKNANLSNGSSVGTLLPRGTKNIFNSKVKPSSFSFQKRSWNNLNTVEGKTSVSISDWNTLKDGNQYKSHVLNAVLPRILCC